MDTYKPQIAKPCHEDWNTMLPNEDGRYCQVCEKTVVDFTAMSLEEIKSYLHTTLNQQTCGRMRNTVNTDIPLIHQQLIKAHETIQTKWTKTIFRGAALFFISLLMTTVGCQYETTTTGELTESVNATSSKDACKTDSLLKADTIYENTLGVMLPPLDSIPDEKSLNK